MDIWISGRFWYKGCRHDIKTNTRRRVRGCVEKIMLMYSQYYYAHVFVNRYFKAGVLQCLLAINVSWRGAEIKWCLCVLGGMGDARNFSCGGGGESGIYANALAILIKRAIVVCVRVGSINTTAADHPPIPAVYIYCCFVGIIQQQLSNCVLCDPYIFYACNKHVWP